MSLPLEKVRVRRNQFQSFQWDRYVVEVPHQGWHYFEHFWAALAHALYITKRKEAR
jgi:hypothetical protein